MTEHSRLINEDCNNISEISERVKVIVNDIIRLSNLTSDAVINNAKESFLNLVRLDHAIWKLSVYNEISEKTYDTSHVADHCDCRLGKWYYEGDGAANYAKYQAFKNLEKPHMDVHSFGKKAIETAKNGDMVGSISYLNKMEEASISVVNSLEDLSKE